MITHIRNFVVTSLLLLSAGLGAAHAQMGAGGGPPAPGNPPGAGGFGGSGMSGREFGPPNFTRDPESRMPEREWPPGRRSPEPSRVPGDNREVHVPLNDAVSLVQERFNATAVKTDTVLDSGQVVYRIRLLSADRSRVWTVSVDARTGRIH